MEEKKVLTNKRQRELIRINQVLAVLVVALSFSTGFLLTIRQSWVTQKVEKISFIDSEITGGSDPLVVHPASPSALTTLLKQARYERVIQSQLISKEDLLAIVWAGQGKITDWGERTVPSYKSMFPLELLVYARNVEGISKGWYRFQARSQQLQALEHTDQAPLLPTETNPSLLTAPVIFVLTTSGDNSQQQMVWNEAGGIAQNILLMSRERQLATYLIPGGSQKSYLWIMPLGTEQKMDIPKKESKP